ncbi:ATP-binding protein [Vibrio coralliirubri]|uniref:ATP-binding protein n=1 Tax=Vibrio coralliirubri TaxID=1516159 RepID=UPI0022833720|nr:ATP-binding protein [Vibrio coralliirubri]MCY9866437.1 ATP-binding protein [Vibrio coralliirubri]
MSKLRSVEFAKDFRCYKAGTKIHLHAGLTLITGENGSGKTSLVGCIRSLYKQTPWTFSDMGAEGILANEPMDKACLYIDLNMDLLRNANDMNYDYVGLQISVMKKSAGQGAMLQLISMMGDCKHEMVILDEPERGLSEASQFVVGKFVERFLNKYPERQIVVNTHSSIIMSILEPYSPLLVAPAFTTISAAAYKANNKRRGELMWDAYSPLLDEEDAERESENIPQPQLD